MATKKKSAAKKAAPKKSPAKPKVVKKAAKVEPVEPVEEVIVESSSEEVEPVEPETEVVDDEPTEPIEMSTEEVAAEAWDAVKAIDDASFATCQPDFKSQLLYHAEQVKRGAQLLSGDSPIARFERKVYEILGG